MEEQVVNDEPFLEPVYLNEKMVLNCAAYIFKGYTLESEINNTTETARRRGGKVGFNFLDRLISMGLEAGSQHSSTSGNRAARRYTVGGLHMSLIDALRSRNMLQLVDSADWEADLDRASYVEVLAELQPVDFYALIDTLRMTIPVIEKILTSIVTPLYDQHKQSQTQIQNHSVGNQNNRRGGAKVKRADKQTRDKVQLALGETSNYATAIQELLEHLEKDYRRSKQIEMVMWSVGENPRPFGVVDLDLADYEPEELRAKLSGGTYHVVGKVTRNVRNGQSINLLQKSVLFSAMSLINQVIEVLGETDGLQNYREKLSTARQMVERFGLLKVSGPALRVTPMSVCI